MKSAVELLTIFAMFSVLSAQTLIINCQFAMIQGRYTCVLHGISVPDDENINIVIGGEHLLGRTNADQLVIDISSSTTPFIITQLFTTFPNIVHFICSNSGLTRIQSSAFANARELRIVTIKHNPTLRTINANAFAGAINLEMIDIFSNQVDTIDEAAFNGLPSLRDLYLEFNRLQQIHINVFKSLTSLEVLSLSDNQLQIIDGRLLEHNLRMWIVNIAGNRINAIARNFFDNMPLLSRLSAGHNICVDQSWNIGGATTIDTVRQGLATCFNNYDKP